VNAPAVIIPMTVEHPDIESYTPTALLRSDGAIEEVDGGAGARTLAENRVLLDLATVFLGGPDSRLDFFIDVASTGWLRVAIERGVLCDGEDTATVVMARESPPFGLTAREMDVLTLIAGGSSNQEIERRHPGTTSQAAIHHRFGSSPAGGGQRGRA
jgi:hypothetical protein